MKALIAFIVMAVVILALIEINERRKAKKKQTKVSSQPSDCKKEQACAECGLVDICEKEDKKA